MAERVNDQGVGEGSTLKKYQNWCFNLPGGFISYILTAVGRKSWTLH
jgi:hypothetical protein